MSILQGHTFYICQITLISYCILSRTLSLRQSSVRTGKQSLTYLIVFVILQVYTLQFCWGQSDSEIVREKWVGGWPRYDVSKAVCHNLTQTSITSYLILDVHGLQTHCRLDILLGRACRTGQSLSRSIRCASLTSLLEPRSKYIFHITNINN